MGTYFSVDVGARNSWRTPSLRYPLYSVFKAFGKVMGNDFPMEFRCFLNSDIRRAKQDVDVPSCTDCDLCVETSGPTEQIGL